MHNRKIPTNKSEFILATTRDVCYTFMRCSGTLHISRRVGMADDADSKSVVGNHVWVQVPPPASKNRSRTEVRLLFL